MEKEDWKSFVELVANAKQVVSSVQDVARKLADYAKFRSKTNASGKTFFFLEKKMNYINYKHYKIEQKRVKTLPCMILLLGKTFPIEFINGIRANKLTYMTLLLVIDKFGDFTSAWSILRVLPFGMSIFYRWAHP